MVDSLNASIFLYRLIGQQRQAAIQPQLAQLSESIAKTLSAIAQQEQDWIAIEDAAFCCFTRTFARDARELLLTDDFQSFVEQLTAADVSDADSSTMMLAIEPEQWQLRTLTVPLQVVRYQVIPQPRYLYRVKLSLGTWQQNLEGSIFTGSSTARQLRSIAAQWRELHQQVQDVDFHLDLNSSRQAQLRQEVGCLACYIGSLICIPRLAAGFTYP